MIRALVLLLIWLCLISDAEAADLQGRFAQGGMITGKVAPGQDVALDGAPVKVSADGRFVIGFGRDAELTHSLSVTEDGHPVETLAIILEDRDFNIERIDGLEPDKVTPPPEYRARRQRETGMVGKARAPVTDMMHWADGFIWPAKGRISGVYGSQRILNGKPRWPHYGVDVAAPAGTPVKAPAAGIVRLAQEDFLLEGGIVIIDHGFGVTSTLFHMRKVTVETGQRIRQGDPIGEIGATGRATGAHVDWRINWRDVRLDPQLLVGDMSQETPAP